ncbi:MAG: arginyltransferase [Spirochaetales bacterium]|nr:arginyltransferase [Spirochaetales bacterium]
MPKDNSLEKLIIKAQLLQKNQQWEEALDIYEQAIKSFPDKVDIYFHRAHLLLEIDDLENAMENYNMALLIEPKNSKAWLEKGFILGFRKGNIPIAISHFDQVPEADPLFLVASLYKGILYYNSKEFSEAESQFNLVIEKNPRFASAYFYRAQLYDIISKYIKANEDYNTAIRLGLNLKEIFFRLSMNYARFKDFDKTKEALLQSHAKAPYTAYSTQHFSCHYFNDGRPASTENIFPDPLKMKQFGSFLEQGYVRSINHYFRHTCPRCKACVPLRVRTKDFIHSTSIKRTCKQNSDLRVEILKTPVIDPARVKLFEKYYKEKHNHHDQESPEQDIAYRHLGFSPSYELDFYLKDKLLAVHIVDIASDAFYAAYLYYDTDYMKRRLGVFCITKAIELAASLGKSFYYMGWYIEDLPVMAYKKQFRPNQLLIDGLWKDF